MRGRAWIDVIDNVTLCFGQTTRGSTGGRNPHNLQVAMTVLDLVLELPVMVVELAVTVLELALDLWGWY